VPGVRKRVRPSLESRTKWLVLDRDSMSTQLVLFHSPR
jgi:hypothetical protein